MIYLASPYTHPVPRVQEERFEAVCKHTAQLMREGRHVFSPIAHSHPLTKYGLPGHWEYWAELDQVWLAACSELWVLKLDGWQDSRGIKAEIEIANELDKPMRYIDPWK